MKPKPIAVAGIQARMGSTRLPGKSLADLDGKPVVQRVWERARRCARVGEAVVCTSTDPSDDPLVEACEAVDVPVRRGPLDDVMGRYLALLEEFPRRYVVRITGDCPLISPEFVDLQLDALEAHDGDLCVLPGGGEAGVLGGQGAFSSRALWSASASEDPWDREHVGAFWLAAHRHELRAVEVEPPPALWRRDLRLCVDEEADLALARAIFEHFSPGWDSAPALADVLAWLDDHPEVRALNERVGESAANRDARRLEGERAARIVGRWPAP